MRRTIKGIVIVMVLFLSFLLSSNLVLANSNGEEYEMKGTEINGKYHQDRLEAVDSKKDLDSKLILKSLRIKDDSISVAGRIINGKRSIDISEEGLLWQSVVSSDNAVGVFDVSRDYSVIGFVIETAYKKDLLLTTTQENFERSNPNEFSIIKIAIKDNIVGGVFYFEWLHQENLFSDKAIAKIFKQPEEETELEESVYRSERWFLFYESQFFKAEEASLSAVCEHAPSMDGNDRAVSPVNGMDVLLFKREGTSQMTIHDIHGWYMTTVGYPAGSGNYLSALTKWSFVVPAKVTKGKTAVFNMKVMASGEYHYRAADDVIEKWSNYASYRIGAAKIGATLKTARGDIFVYYRYDQQYNSTTHNIFYQILGLWKRTTTLGAILTILDEISSSTVYAQSDSFHDTLYACGLDYGYDNNDSSKPKAPLCVGITTPGSKKMYKVDDRLILEAQWKKPLDASDYYTYVSGSKTLQIAFEYSVYIGNTKVLNNKTRVYTRNYK